MWQWQGVGDFAYQRKKEEDLVYQRKEIEDLV